MSDSLAEPDRMREGALQQAQGEHVANGGKTNKKALAHAMRERRHELHLSQRTAAERTREKDLKYLGGRQRRHPGVSSATWAHLEQCRIDRPYPHTLLVIDAALKWPEGKAAALFHDEPIPDGPSPIPHEDPSLAELRREMEAFRSEVETLRQQTRELDIAVAERDRDSAVLNLENADLRLQLLYRSGGPDSDSQGPRTWRSPGSSSSSSTTVRGGGTSR